MHDTQLHVGERPGRPDRFGEALETVAADDERIRDATIAELGQHRHPELGSHSVPAG